jgi:hypothetical protein
MYKKTEKMTCNNELENVVKDSELITKKIKPSNSE